MADKKFIDGLIFKSPHERAPDWIIAKISIKREDLIKWLQSQPGEWINADLKESQGGTYYAEVDEWKPDQQRGQQTQRQERAPRSTPPQQPAGGAPVDDEIPF